MKPSQTPAGIRWLSNFGEAEQATALLLLDALYIATTTKIRAALQGALVTAENYDEPAVLYPIRALDDFPGNVLDPVAFVDFDPSASLPADPGSEALTANMLRNIASGHAGLLGPATDLETLRNGRCRSVVFVEDYAGSGDQCLEYADSWFSNPTIRSWKSFGWVRFHVLLFAASAQATDRISRDRRFHSVTIIEQAPTLWTVGWDSEQEDAVLKLCRNYTTRPDLAFGWRGSGGLFVMQHTVPDNLPYVLWQKDGPATTGKSWQPLLPDRKVPNDLLESASKNYTETKNFAAVASGLGSERLAQALTRPNPVQEKQVLLILGACANGIRHLSQLVAHTALPKRIVEACLRDMREWDLLDDHQRLTDRGHAELVRQGRRPRHATIKLNEPEGPYYPMRLRGVEDF